jgi:uncharacterized protein (TIGR03083 family)
MNDTGFVALVDTDRNELRTRIQEARQRFYQLAGTADPNARRRGLDWNVHQVIAHVLSVAHRYQAIIEGRNFRRAVHPRDLDQINHEEMLAAMAPIPELLEDLEALEPVMDAFFDGLPDDYMGEFHTGAMISGIVWQVNWLFDLVLHGEDIARAVGAPASTMVRLFLHRIGPFTAARQGLRIVGGRRPWKAMQLQSCIERA